MSGVIPPLPNTSSWCGAQLKYRDNFNFTFAFYHIRKDPSSNVKWCLSVPRCSNKVPVIMLSFLLLTGYYSVTLRRLIKRRAHAVLRYVIRYCKILFQI
jgi:hypothetical protein